jgi:hypothetical protein
MWPAFAEIKNLGRLMGVEIGGTLCRQGATGVNPHFAACFFTCQF